MKRKAGVRCVATEFAVWMGRVCLGRVSRFGDGPSWCVSPDFGLHYHTCDHPTRAAAVRALVKAWREAGNG